MQTSGKTNDNTDRYFYYIKQWNKNGMNKYIMKKYTYARNKFHELKYHFSV